MSSWCHFSPGLSTGDQGKEGKGAARGRAPHGVPPCHSSQHRWDEHAVIDVRERPVPEVVAQARYAYTHALHVRDPQLGLLRVQVVDELATEVGHAQAVLKAIVGGARKDVVCSP